MNFTIEIEPEENGRWLAEVLELAGVLAYGQTKEEAIAEGGSSTIANVQALAFQVLADRLINQEAAPELMHVSFKAA